MEIGDPGRADPGKGVRRRLTLETTVGGSKKAGMELGAGEGAIRDWGIRENFKILGDSGPRGGIRRKQPMPYI